MLIHSYKCTDDIDCISDIAYDSHKAMFPICMTTIAICLFIGMFITTTAPLCWLAILPTISIIGVGFTPYKDGKTLHNLHYTFALMSFISTFVLWSIKGWWFIPFLFCIAALRKKWLLGLEMGLIGSGFLYILL